MYHPCYRLTEKDMKWQGTNSLRSILFGYKIKLGQFETVIHCHFAWFTRKRHFGLNLMVSYLIHLSFHVVYVFRNSCITSQKTSRSSLKMKFEDYFGKTLFRGSKTTLKYQNLFSMRGNAVVFEGSSVNYLPLSRFCDQKLLRGTSFNVFSKKL